MRCVLDRSLPPSLPFSMGAVLHPGGGGGEIYIATRIDLTISSRFSPLLDGDGVASCHGGLHSDADIPRFSPLLDGDSVASFRTREGC